MNKQTSILAIFIAILIGLGMGSCKSRKKLTSNNLPGRVSGKILEKVLKSELDYSSLEIKGSAKTDAFGKKYSFSITYRNLPDSLIWISARAILGIEAARLICTQDSVWVISRIAQVKEKGDWKTMSDMIGYPIDFFAFQGMMARKLFIPGKTNTALISNFISRENENGLLLAPDFSDASIKECMQENEFMPQFLIDTNQKLLCRTRISPEDSSWLLDIIYGSESEQSLGGLPSNIHIDAIDMEEKMEFDMKLNAVTIDRELKFPFAWF